MLRRRILAVLVLVMIFHNLGGGLAGTQVKAQTLEALQVPVITQMSLVSSVVSPVLNLSLSGMASGDQRTVVPLVIDRPGVVQLLIGLDQPMQPIRLTLYSDEACQVSLSDLEEISLTEAPQSIIRECRIPEAGTYYLAFSWASSAPVTGSAIQLAARAFQDRELTIGSEAQAVYTADAGVSRYHKLVMKKDGYVVLGGATYRYQKEEALWKTGELSAALCDKNKKKLAGFTFKELQSFGERFSLKKGIYYLAVASDCPYEIKTFSCKNWKEQAGKNRAKARLLRKKKTVRGMLAMTDKRKQSDWFKIRLDKSDDIKLDILAGCTGTKRLLKVEVIPANRHYRLLNSSITLGNFEDGKNIREKLRFRNKMNRGTYYLKLTKLSKDFSCAYRIQYR